MDALQSIPNFQYDRDTFQASSTVLCPRRSRGKKGKIRNFILKFLNFAFYDRWGIDNLDKMRKMLPRGLSNIKEIMLTSASRHFKLNCRALFYSSPRKVAEAKKQEISRFRSWILPSISLQQIILKLIPRDKATLMANRLPLLLPPSSRSNPINPIT